MNDHKGSTSIHHPGGAARYSIDSTADVTSVWIVAATDATTCVQTVLNRLHEVHKRSRQRGVVRPPLLGAHPAARLGMGSVDLDKSAQGQSRLFL